MTQPTSEPPQGSGAQSRWGWGQGAGQGGAGRAAAGAEGGGARRRLVPPREAHHLRHLASHFEMVSGIYRLPAALTAAGVTLMTGRPS